MHQINQNSVEVNDEPRGTFNKINQIRFKTSMLRSSICTCLRNYNSCKHCSSRSDNAANKKVIFKNCAPLTNCISRRNNTQIDDAHYINVAMPVYNLIE